MAARAKGKLRLKRRSQKEMTVVKKERAIEMTALDKQKEEEKEERKKWEKKWRRS